jgi:hypothetical protein
LAIRGYAFSLRLIAAPVVLSLAVFVLTVLYLTGPETKCAHELEPRQDGGGVFCLRFERTNAWERISGAVTG